MTSDHKVDTGDGMSCDNCQNNLSYRTVNTELYMSVISSGVGIDIN